MHLHGLSRDAELDGDFLVGKAVEIAEQNDLAATIGERAHGVGEHFEFVALVELLTRPRPILQNRKLDQIRDRLGRLRTTAAEKVERRIARSGEEKRFRVTYAAGGLRAEEARIRFLHEIVVFTQGRKTRLQVSPQRPFMGLDFLREPTGLFRRQHGAMLTGVHPSMRRDCRVHSQPKPAAETIFC